MFRASFIRTSRRTFGTTTRLQKIIPEATQTTPGKRPGDMTGDAAAVTGTQGASSAINSAGVHQSKPEGDPVGEKKTGSDPPVFNKDGAVGKQFKADGAIGSIGEKVGGPFASDGAIGKNFNPDGAVGGTVHENLGKKE